MAIALVRLAQVSGDCVKSDGSQFRKDVPHRLKTKMMTTIKSKTDRRTSGRGFTLLELIVLVGVSAIVMAIALPAVSNSRRLQRLAAIPKLVSTQLRLARQLAMSQRRAVTFQYDDSTKQIKLISQPTFGTAVLTNSNYPNLSGSAVVNTMPLTAAGLALTDITYGIPSGTPTYAPTTALGDTATMTSLSINKVNITFQPDGSVINSSGQPVNYALYFYNSQLPADTASAISVLGGAGRVKVWRYSSSAAKYVE